MCDIILFFSNNNSSTYIITFRLFLPGKSQFTVYGIMESYTACVVYFYKDILSLLEVVLLLKFNLGGTYIQNFKLVCCMVSNKNSNNYSLWRSDWEILDVHST